MPGDPESCKHARGEQEEGTVEAEAGGTARTHDCPVGGGEGGRAHLCFLDFCNQLSFHGTWQCEMALSGCWGPEVDGSGGWVGLS